MAWVFSADKPIFQQIMDIITADILSGKYKNEEKLASVRDLAMEAGVNPNTMQKALSELERIGLLYSKQGDGRYINQNSSELQNLKQANIASCISEMAKSLIGFGLSEDEIINEVEKFFKGAK